MTGVTVFPAAREEGQAVNMARCTCPATQNTFRASETEKGKMGIEEGEVEVAKRKADNERLTRERRHLY